jgi:hypothetical protein
MVDEEGQRAGARVAKAQVDSRALASAVSIYSAHMDTVPNALANLMPVATLPAIPERAQRVATEIRMLAQLDLPCPNR